MSSPELQTVRGVHALMVIFMVVEFSHLCALQNMAGHGWASELFPEETYLLATATPFMGKTEYIRSDGRFRSRM